MVRHAIAKERGFERARMAFLWCVEGGVPPNRYDSNADVFYGSEYSEHTLSGTVIGSRPDGAGAALRGPLVSMEHSERVFDPHGALVEAYEFEGAKEGSQCYRS